MARNKDVFKDSVTILAEIMSTFYMGDRFLSGTLRGLSACGLLKHFVVCPLSRTYFRDSTKTMFTILSFYIIETNTSGKKAENCQLSAVDQSNLHCFNDYNFGGC